MININFFGISLAGITILGASYVFSTNNQYGGWSILIGGGIFSIIFTLAVMYFKQILEIDKKNPFRGRDSVL